MQFLKEYLSQHPSVKDYVAQNFFASHLSETQESLLLYGAFLQKKTPIFVVKENEIQVENLKGRLLDLDSNLNVITFTYESSLRIEAIASSQHLKYNRIAALSQIIDNDYDICIVSSGASLRKISPKHVLKSKRLHLKVGDILSPEQLMTQLQNMGYTKVKYVEHPFTYAMRGGICDVYSIQNPYPLRIEFFDIELESLRYFDIDSQRSIDNVSSAEILFASEILLQEEDLLSIEETMQDDLIKAPIETQETVMMDLELIKHMQYEESHYPLLAYWERYETILDYVEESLVVISPIEAVMRNTQESFKDMVSFVQEKHEANQLLLNYNLYADKSKIESIHAIHHFEYEHVKELKLPWHKANMVSNDLRDTFKVIKNEAKNHRVIVCVDVEQYETLVKHLVEEKIHYENFQQQELNGLYLELQDLNEGYILDDIKTIIYSKKEIFEYSFKKYRYDAKFFQAESLHRLNDLDTFDYVVHRQYGIGKYMGISTREVDGIHKDFMRIQYRDNDELFVPLEQFNLVRKYISSEAVAIRLSKLGSSAWRKNQQRIKDSIDDIADNLIQLYTTRSKAQGFAFSKDNEYQLKFESEFPYELTPDQKIAIDEIKTDMESSAPMDRLLIGDVGFGKTEVAIRAAFKAIVDEKQVIFLCPTTILSAQHFETFSKRFQDYPIKIEVLNRFVSAKKQKEVIKQFKQGQVDILIGTHRVLSKDVKAHDLGLLIIDEEQRFGVEHKEKIKEYKVNIDVLSLSATPIPRTLQMSLIGIRSLSQLNTPPSNRLPVMTYIIEKDQRTIFDVITKELNREGQVFYLFNNVDMIYNVATQIQQGVPIAKVAVVHGQMDKDEIEDVMLRFINKEVNVLVTTTIIETGIDIPNANTILVDNAHRFGLSQLYQIKGRVGRSDRLAYAYFLVPHKKNLTEVATKRLQAIKEFTQLGSGYKIAMRDLTIRGAGELLGGNQSGFIDSIGIELYVELLKEAINIKQGKQVEVEKPQLQLNIEGYLPDNFTTDDQEKLDLYQEINAIQTVPKLSLMLENLKDRYGKLPNAVSMLMEKKRLEIFLEDERIESFKEKKTLVELKFTPEYSDKMDGSQLFEVVSERSHDIKIKYLNKMISLDIPVHDYWFEDVLYILENIKEKGA